MKKVHSFWAPVFQYGYFSTICSKHKTMQAAINAAKRCEKAGGAPHEIWEVRVYPHTVIK